MLGVVSKAKINDQYPFNHEKAVCLYHNGTFYLGGGTASGGQAFGVSPDVITMKFDPKKSEIEFFKNGQYIDKKPLDKNITYVPMMYTQEQNTETYFTKNPTLKYNK